MRGAVRLAAISEAQGHLLVDPRLGRPRRGRPDPPADRAPRRRCGPCPASASSARPTPTRPPRPGGSPIDRDGPTALILSRQDLPVLDGTPSRPTACAKGAYVLAEPMARDARRPRRRPHRHRQRGLRCASTPPSSSRPTGSRVRVVSMPCWELFDEQDDDYQDDGAPAGRADARRRGGVVVRLGPLGRRQRVASTASAPRRPAQVALENLGFTADERRRPRPPAARRPRPDDRGGRP